MNGQPYKYDGLPDDTALPATLCAVKGNTSLNQTEEFTSRAYKLGTLKQKHGSVVARVMTPPILIDDNVGGDLGRSSKQRHNTTISQTYSVCSPPNLHKYK